MKNSRKLAKTVEKSTVFWYNKSMEKQIDFTKMSRKELEEFAMKQCLETETLKMQVEQYRELLRRGQAEKYGAKNEKSKPLDNQLVLSIFNEAEEAAKEEMKEPDIASVCPPKKYAPKRRKGCKAERLAGVVKRETQIFTLTEEERRCPRCGNMTRKMSTVKRREVEVTMPEVKVRTYVQHIYVCDYCEKHTGDTTILNAQMPKGLLRGSYVSPSMAAWMFTRKFDGRDSLYQLEGDLRRQGAKIGRDMLSSWMLNLSKKFLAPLYDGLREELLRRPFINLDETPVQVLREDGRTADQKSYMWVAVSGEEENPIILFHYAPSRGGNVIEEFLAGYQGLSFQADGYGGYNGLGKKLTRIGCMAHVRRKFHAVVKSAKKKSGKAYELALQGLAYCNELFEYDRQAAGADEEKAREIKEKASRKTMEALISWAEENVKACPAGTLIYKALNYTVEQQKYLLNYLDDPKIRISNNAAERAIRPFATGRKIWLFCVTPKGAEASEKAYSIIETAKANHLDPHKYLLEIFECARGKKTLSAEDVERLLPWNEEIQEKCRCANR